MEIERKFLVKEIPNLNNLKYHNISQGYLNTDSEPMLRVRKIDDEFFLTYKFNQQSNVANKCVEYELPITRKAYENLLKKIDGIVIKKKRYLIYLENNLTAELDIFEGFLDGLKIVEVEFDSEESANKFNAPTWFGDDVTKEKKYRNAYLSKGEIDI